MIDPGTKEEGEEFESYCRRRWGGSGWTNHLRQEGRKDGANFSSWKWWPNTRKGHQLVLYAKNQGIDTSTSNENLFRAVYEEGENISLIDSLVKVGVMMGLNESDIKDYLERDMGATQVAQEIRLGSQKYGIRGVPFFVIDGVATSRPYGISGAHDSQTFLELFRDVSGEEG
jgi:predicted DsbA family dithiol-disulfide isomerase